MKRFLTSGWLPLLTCILLAAGTAGAFAMLKPAGADMNSAELVHYFTIAGWATGPVIAVLSLILIGVLHLLRKLLRLRLSAAYIAVLFLGVLPWFVFAWQLTAEKRYTPFAMGVIDFVARPMLWGALIASLFSLVLLILSFIPSRPK